MPHKAEPQGQPPAWPISRRGFLTGVGAGALCAAAAGRIFAQTAGKTPSAARPTDDLARITLNVNDRPYDLLVEPRWTLLFVLREKLGLTGSKEGCGRGECGACTVLIDGIPRYACLTLAVEAASTSVTTVEGLLRGEELGPVQSAFVEEDALQCGYCTPGQIMAVEGLLRANPDPSVEEIRTAVSGNLCRCGAYSHILKAAATAAKLRKR
jgi:xanthine dehydrogenase YagT iron-sulfur-binding subunit